MSASFFNQRRYWVLLLLPLIVWYAVRTLYHLPIIGIEFQYLYSVPKPARSALLYYSDPPGQTIDTRRMMRGRIKRSEFAWRESFHLPMKIREPRLLRFVYQHERQPLYLLEIHYLTRLPLLGDVILLNQPPGSVLRHVVETHAIEPSLDGDMLVMDLKRKMASFDIKISQRDIVQETPMATKLLVVTYLTLLAGMVLGMLYGVLALGFRFARRHSGGISEDSRTRSAAPDDEQARNHENATLFHGPILYSQPRDPWPWVLLLGIIFLIVTILRLSGMLTEPGLFFEDSYEYFSALNAAPTIFDWSLFTKHGYNSLLSILLGWVAAYFPYNVQPHLYYLFAIMFVLACVVTASVSGLLKTRPYQLLATIVLGMLGINHVFFYTTLAYVIYTSIILLLLLIVIARPGNARQLIGWLVVVSPLIWSGPYAVVAIPASIVVAAFSVGQRYRLLFLGLVIVETLISFITISQGVSQLGALTSLQVFTSYATSLVNDVFLFGLADIDSGALIAALFLLPAALLLPFWKDKRFVKQIVILSAIIYTSQALFFYSIKFVFMSQPKPGHLEIPVYFWTLMLLVVLERMSLSFHQRMPAFRSLSIGTLLLLALSVNLRFPDHYHYPVNPDLPHFLSTADAVRNEMSSRQDHHVVMRFKGWAQDIVLGIGNKAGKSEDGYP